MAATSPTGASLSSHGLADLAMYEGRWSTARQILVSGIAADEKANYTNARAAKLVALAEVHLAERQLAEAAATARTAIASIREDATLVPAAFVLLDAGRADEAKAIADGLLQQFQPRSRAYGEMINARIAQRSGRLVDSVTSLQNAQKHADLWLGRFLMARTQVEAERYPQASGDLDECQRRSGEATAIFLDDVPTFRYLSPVPYWTGRVQQGMGNSSAAAENYKTFLTRRPTAGDPLADDARKRLSTFTSAQPGR
jgi:tetratricopeptide (TPR) repeat protein